MMPKPKPANDAQDAARYRVLRSIALGDDLDAWTRIYFELDSNFPDAAERFDAFVSSVLSHRALTQ